MLIVESSARSEETKPEVENIYAQSDQRNHLIAEERNLELEVSDPGLNSRTGEFDRDPVDASGAVVVPAPQVVIPKGTSFVITINDGLDSTTTRAGEWRVGTTQCELQVDGYRLPKASTFVVEVVKVKKARRFFGSPGRISVKFRELELPDGRRVEVSAQIDKTKTRLVGGLPGERGRKVSSNAKRGFAAGATVGIGAAPLVTIAGSCVLTPAGGIVLGALTPVATGAIGCLIGALITKGDNLVIGPGAQMEVVLDRDLKIDATDPRELAKVVPFDED